MSGFFGFRILAFLTCAHMGSHLFLPFFFSACTTIFCTCTCLFAFWFFFYLHHCTPPHHGSHCTPPQFTAYLPATATPGSSCAGGGGRAATRSDARRTAAGSSSSAHACCARTPCLPCHCLMLAFVALPRTPRCAACCAATPLPACLPRARFCCAARHCRMPACPTSVRTACLPALLRVGQFGYWIWIHPIPISIINLLLLNLLFLTSSGASLWDRRPSKLEKLKADRRPSNPPILTLDVLYPASCILLPATCPSDPESSLLEV